MDNNEKIEKLRHTFNKIHHMGVLTQAETDLLSEAVSQQMDKLRKKSGRPRKQYFLNGPEIWFTEMHVRGYCTEEEAANRLAYEINLAEDTCLDIIKKLKPRVSMHVQNMASWGIPKGNLSGD